MSSTDSKPLSDRIINEILMHHDQGGEVLFARSHTGEQRIKVRYGLLNLRIKRYTVDYQTAATIKDALSKRLGLSPRLNRGPFSRVLEK